MTMKHNPILLDEHRGMAAQQATEILSAPASTWPEAAEKARYLIGLFAATSSGRDPRRQKLIAGVLDDFVRLSGESAAGPPRQLEADSEAAQ
jgi:hypothetical protein